MTSSEITILKRFGAAIRKRRIELGISQEYLADKSGLHRTYVGDIERGERNPSLRNIERLATALEISMGDFFTHYLGDK